MCDTSSAHKAKDKNTNMMLFATLAEDIRACDVQ